ncbi:hypothetical protein ABTW96_03780 [Nocardia beijingensis]|uniref:hypothetical protein n=1 Tax=Nocardia beijingensis TaxID=95162 RepID=UPI00333278A4
MVPEGNLAAIFLDLLRAAGLPAAVVFFVGTVMALYQFAANLNEQAHGAEQSIVNAFASSSRRVRAYGLFVISHIVAIAVMTSVIAYTLNDPALSSHVALSTGSMLIKAQAGIAAYFLLIDWWSLRHGDALPHHLGAIVGLIGGLIVLSYGVFKAMEDGAWLALLLWFTVAFSWFRVIGWASSTGSGLARAMQGA